MEDYSLFTYKRKLKIPKFINKLYNIVNVSYLSKHYSIKRIVDSLILSLGIESLMVFK